MVLAINAALTSPLFNPVGIIIAIVFLTSIVGVLSWMLRLPNETEVVRSATKAVRSVNKLTRILVPILYQNEVTDRAVALAVQMARHRNGLVEVLAVIDVPFVLPLDARMEVDEQHALELLDHATSIAGHVHSMTKVIKHVLKARNPGVAIVRDAEQHVVDVIIIANTPARLRGTMQQIDPTVEYVLKNAPCEVLVLSQAQGSAASERSAKNQPVQAVV